MNFGVIRAQGIATKFTFYHLTHISGFHTKEFPLYSHIILYKYNLTVMQTYKSAGAIGIDISLLFPSSLQSQKHLHLLSSFPCAR